MSQAVEHQQHSREEEQEEEDSTASLPEILETE